MRFFTLIATYLVVFNSFSQSSFDSIRMQLEEIHHLDQRYRLIEFPTTEDISNLKKADSSNQVKVQLILDKFGWIGPQLIGDSANSALFLVLQHAPYKLQENYLDMMKTAGTKGDAAIIDYVYLEDRVNLVKIGYQKYGTQLIQNPFNGKVYIRPIENPEQLDERRLAVGLNTMNEYLSEFGLHWDLAQYYKDLPLVQAKFKSK